MTDESDAARPIHDCAAVERDNLDLHQALSEAIKRLQHIDPMYGSGPHSPARSQDLREILDRTSRPAHNADRVHAASDPRNQGTTRP